MIPAGARLPQPQVGISRQMASFGQNVLRAVAPHAEEHRSADARAGASPAQARCDASRSMRANRVARPHPSRRAHARSSLRNVSASALLRMDEHRVLQSSPYKQPFSFPRRFRRGTRWLVRSLYFPVFLRIRNLPSPVSRSQTTHTPSFPRRISCARGLHLCFTHPESRGGRSAERRSGARRNTRKVRHNAAYQALARRLASHSASRRA